MGLQGPNTSNIIVFGPYNSIISTNEGRYSDKAGTGRRGLGNAYGIQGSAD